MLSNVEIANFKSLSALKIELGRVTVLIGENGSGKSNILEGLALASAAASNKLEQEFLISRGIRVTEPEFMQAAFAEGQRGGPITIGIEGENDLYYRCRLYPRNERGYIAWNWDADRNPLGEDLRKALARLDEQEPERGTPEEVLRYRREWRRINAETDRRLAASPLGTFLIYSPENSSLRVFEREGQIQPLGIKGEGLFKLLKVLSGEEHLERLREIKEQLRLIDWFGDFRVSPDLAPYERVIQIRDRFLPEDMAYFDQRSANEGFLFLLFYFTVLVSPQTPTFFAIDNIDASLNPKLCVELVRRIAELTRRHGKQVLLTTHNPAVLDGLDLTDDAQRLLVVYRNSKGHTRVRRVTVPQPIAGEPPVRLSEAFLRGILGGLPQNF